MARQNHDYGAPDIQDLLRELRRTRFGSGGTPGGRLDQRFNNRRLLGPSDYLPPTEYERGSYPERPPAIAGIARVLPPSNPGRFTPSGGMPVVTPESRSVRDNDADEPRHAEQSWPTWLA